MNVWHFQENSYIFCEMHALFINWYLWAKSIDIYSTSSAKESPTLGAGRN